MDEVNKSYYAIIPANVRYDKDLCANAKLLYGEITALTNDRGYCWAQNDYFAKLYKVSKTSISKWISQLCIKNYIYRKIEYKENSKEILHRYLTIVKEPIEEKLNTPIEEKLKDNITVYSLNNTINIYTEKILSYWNNKENLQTHKVDTVKLYIKKRHNDILKSYSENEILRAIDNYSDILMDNDKYYFSHRWPIWDFIIRGLHNFLDSSTPKINYLNKYKKDNDGIENNFIPQGTREKIFNKK